MVDLPSSPLAEVDPLFEQMALETGQLTYGLSGTSVREKFLQIIASDVCRLNLGLAFRMHLTAAVAMHGVPYADILALICFVAPYAGYPAAADALGRLPEIAAELDLDTTHTLDPDRDPVDGGRPGQPDAIPASPDAWAADFLASRIGRSWSEERLSPRERALVALTTDVCFQTFGPTFQRSVRLARESGVQDNELRDAVRFTAELGIARTISALRELDKILG
jgi:4-carboxymuconolactone decarboxylase